MLHIKTHQNTQGSALLSALFIMTLVAICATAMSMRLQLDIYRTRLTIGSDKLYLASQLVNFWASDVLSRPALGFKSAKEGGKLIDFPKKMEKIYPDVVTKGSLYDLQAVFNLNNISNTKYQSVLINLLEHLLPNIPGQQREKLTSAISYWINPYHPEYHKDDQINLYLNHRPPYLPGFQFMRSPSELRLITSVNATLYQTLTPSITTLPEVTPININTASSALIMSLGNGLNQTELHEFILAKGHEGFKNINILMPLLEKLNIPVDEITLESIYYLSIATTSSTDLNLSSYCVLKRSKDKQGRIKIDIISESLNTL